MLLVVTIQPFSVAVTRMLLVIHMVMHLDPVVHIHNKFTLKYFLLFVTPKPRQIFATIILLLTVRKAVHLEIERKNM